MVYVIRKDGVPVTIMFVDAEYKLDPEYCRINTAPMAGAVFERDNVKVHKFINSLTQGT